MSSSVKVIADSISPEGKRITTLECKYWRGIHAELMTHRAFARNAASSRAIPFLAYKPSENEGGPSMNQLSPKCTVSTLLSDPFIPEFIGAEQKGMQSGEELGEWEKSRARTIIHESLSFMLEQAKELHTLGVHKSIINRYLEPWSYITVVITATEWDNFFKLRCHSAAEKHFQKLALQMQAAMAESKPRLIEFGQWHLPYMDESDTENIRIGMDGNAWEVMKKVSAARCARVSYLTHDGKRDLAADLALAERLLNPGDGAIHASPFEHVATPTYSVKGTLQPSGPFIGWRQYRKEIPGETYIAPRNKKQKAEERGAEMACIPMNQLPPLALKYARYLCSRFGACGEVYITAYAHYAQAVEKLPCYDDLYQIDQLGLNWFNENKE